MQLKILVLLLLLWLPLVLALTVDQNKVCFPYAGGTTSSTSYQTRVSVEQGYIGRGTSSSYAAELGCIYGFENTAPTIGLIRICDGTCAVTKSLSNTTWFTLEVTVNDPNGVADINTQSFRVTLYHNTDANSAAESWDVNALYLRNRDDNLMLATANGCEQSAGIYCINIPSAASSIKFLDGDMNIYVAVDDNSRAYDMNAVDRNAFTVLKRINTEQDTTSGTYSGNPNTSDNAFSSTQTTFAYVQTTHTGNAFIDVNAIVSDLNVSAAVFIGDGNQSWKAHQDDGPGSAAFTGGQDIVFNDMNRGTYPSNAVGRLFTYLDVPAFQPTGSYTGTHTYGQTAS